MSNATSLQWIMPPTQAGFDPATSHTARFLASFPNITHLSYFSHFLCPEVQVYFMSFFQNLRKCTFSLWGTNGLMYFFSGHGPQINLSQLEEIWIEECEPAGAMDWLLDNVLHNAPYPIRIRKLGWEFRDPPFSSDTFARLIGMVRGTLEELCFRPPWTPDGLEDCEAPPFGFNVLPVLRILSFRILYLSYESDRIMHWLNSIFAGFPSCPCLQRLEFAFYLAKSENINTVSAFDFLDWKSLLEDRYPSLKVLEFEMMMEDEEAFDVAERKRVETIVRQSTRMANSKKFVMQWSRAR
ncbi:hypothetical protein CPB85DRAFT_565065 [Mucidula mucida]|nr:hypothetical protein CPB85DRAFT_565065 [Mucidula mucida]